MGSVPAAGSTIRAPRASLSLDTDASLCSWACVPRSCVSSASASSQDDRRPQHPLHHIPAVLLARRLLLLVGGALHIAIRLHVSRY